jgi:exopolysaccharide biosynthesis polyprenyl glycosylphosphotransferase
MSRPVTRPAPSAEPRAPRRPDGDIRARTPYAFSPRPFVALARRGASVATLVVLDVCGLTLGVYGALTLRELYYGHTPPLWGVLWRYEGDWLPFLTLVTVLVFWQGGLYAPRERRPGVGRIIGSIVLVAVVTIAFGLGTGALDFSTYGFFPTAAVLTAVVIALLRASYGAATGELLRLTGVKRRTMLVGAPETLLRLRSALGSRRSGIDYDFVAEVGLEELPPLLEDGDVDEVIVADSDFAEAELLEIVDLAQRRGAMVRVAPKTTELLTSRGEYVPGQGVPLFELRPPVFAGADWVVKRAFDLAVSAGVVVIGFPVWLAIALLIKLTSPGPIFYRDRRVGLNEREFTMLKFRTMHADAEARQRDLEPRNEADGPLFKIRDDPRVTGVGRLLRRLSLDELPQVLNVVRGEMSLVGPRPLRLRDFSLLNEWHRKRNLVLPGMTGLWQISGRSLLSFDDLVRLDFYYLENWSLWLDVTILIQTVPAVLRARGAY